MVPPPDAEGDPEVDLALSNRRVEAVAAALASDGLKTADFKVVATAPIRRRADVTLRLAKAATR